MITSLDGRLLPGRWPASDEEVMTVYESAAERLDSDGWIVGRRTMEDFIASAEPCISTGPVPRPDLMPALLETRSQSALTAPDVYAPKPETSTAIIL